MGRRRVRPPRRRARLPGRDPPRARPCGTCPGATRTTPRGWQAYFHTRNRLVAAALHTQYKHGGDLLRDTFKFDLKFLIMLQYATAALHHRAYDDFLAGPEELFPLLPTALPTRPGAPGRLPRRPGGRLLRPTCRCRRWARSKAERFMKPPTTPLTIGRTLLAALVHNVRSPKPEAAERPQLNISAQDARWFLLSRLDSATVGTADGRGVTFRRREQEIFWRMLRHSVSTPSGSTGSSPSSPSTTGPPRRAHLAGELGEGLRRGAQRPLSRTPRSALDPQGAGRGRQGRVNRSRRPARVSRSHSASPPGRAGGPGRTS